VTIRRRLVWRRKEGPAELTVDSRDGQKVTVDGPAGPTLADIAKLADGRRSVILPSGRQLTGRASSQPDGRIEAWIGARRIQLELVDPLRNLAAESESAEGGAMEIRAQIPGRVVEVFITPGEVVAAGKTLLVLEAMKMQNEIRADSPARVAKVECAAGQTVETGALLVRLEPELVV
jgi:biotin carboxyl carrier protein